jgi:hypothetical protein
VELTARRASLLRRIIPAALAAMVFIAPIAPPQAQAAEMPACIVGNFRLTDYDAIIRSAMPDAPPSAMTYVSGEALESMNASGAYENTYRQLTFSMAVGAIPVTMTFDGWEKGTARESGPGRLSAATTELAVTITLSADGHSESTTLTDPTGISADLEYECQGDRVITHHLTPTVNGGPPARIRAESVRIQ